MERTSALALVGGTIYASSAEKPIRDRVVLIRDDKITAVGKRIGQTRAGAFSRVCRPIIFPLGAMSPHRK